MRKEFEKQLVVAIKSCPIVYIPHFHYAFVDDVLLHLLSNRRMGLPPNLKVIEYDYARNILIDFETKENHKDANEESFDFFQNWILGDSKEEQIIILKNATHLVKRDTADHKTISFLQFFAEKYEQGAYNAEKTIIIVTPEPASDLPVGLEGIVSIINIEAPNDSEIYNEIKTIPFVSSVKTDEQKETIRKDLCRTLLGLQYYDVKQIIRSALLPSQNLLSPLTIATALKEKKQVVRKSGIIDVIDTDIRFNMIGGLDILKKDLIQKATIFRNLREANSYGLPLPKGILIIGMPGCGKSMIAKAIANEFNVSLLRLDIGRLMGQYVGQSESNLRKALAVAEAAHPCVLWIDEIEKAFAGTDGNNRDMLVTRLMGYFLTWMQERKTAVYIVATANDVMKPEFMRKGRFDDVYFVDFPNAQERKEIFEAKLEPFKHSCSDIINLVLSPSDIQYISNTKLNGFSGAEIECVVNSVVENLFVDYLSSGATVQERKKQVASKDVFEIAIKKIEDSITSKQKSTDPNHQTNIEKILAFQKIYKFTLATSKNK